jgi:predicted permease
MSIMDGLLQDLRFAARTLIKQPGFTIVAIITLALGIGANTAIFSLVNGVFLKGVAGIDDPTGLVEITRDVGGRVFDMSYPIISDVREGNEVLEDMAAFTPIPVAIGGEGEPTVKMSLSVTGNYFSVLRLRPALGRFFAPDESFFPNVPSASVISHRMWEERFNSSPDVLGKTIVVNGYPTAVIGVAPPGFGAHVVGLQVGVYLPIGIPIPGLRSAEELQGPENGILEVVGRLRPGVSVTQARAALTALADGALNARTGSAFGTYVMRVEKWGPVPSAARTAITVFFAVLMTVVALVLSMACVNVANMILSRTAERRAEIAVRLAMGASRRRLVRQLLTESLLLFTVAGAAGVLLSVWASNLLLAFEPPLPAGIDVELDLGLDWRVLLFSLTVSVVTAVAFSLAPALRATRSDLVSTLKDESRSGGPVKTRLRSVMVGSQMAATVTLLIVAGLFLRTLSSLESLDTGWDGDNVGVVTIDAELSGMDRERGREFFRELATRAKQITGVEAASLAAKLPLGGRSSFGNINVEGVEAPQGQNGFSAFLNRVTPGYFRTLNIRLLQGRDVSDDDTGGKQPVAVINRAMAQRFWPDADPIGKHFYTGQVSQGRDFEVIGVVENAKYGRLVEEIPNFYYVSADQWYPSAMSLHMRIAPGAERAVAAQIRQVVRQLDANLPVQPMRPMNDLLQVFFLPQRVAAWVAGVMGFVGLLLGAVGVYGVTAFAVGQRRREIGVRIALGADTSNVLSLMMRRGLVAPMIGMVAGLAVTVIATRLLTSLIPGVSPLDPLTFGSVIAILAAVAVLATLLPARKAVRLDPVEALRAE